MHIYTALRTVNKIAECHADFDDNYLVHAIGDVHWKVYDKRLEGIMQENGHMNYKPGLVC